MYWFGMARRLGVPTAPGTRGVPTIHADASRTIVACRSCRGPCARRAAAPYTARPNDPTATKEFGKTTPKPAWRQPIPSPSHRIMNASERSLRQATFTPLLGRHPSLSGSADRAWPAERIRFASTRERRSRPSCRRLTPRHPGRVVSVWSKGEANAPRVEGRPRGHDKFAHSSRRRPSGGPKSRVARRRRRTVRRGRRDGASVRERPDVAFPCGNRCLSCFGLPGR